MRRARSAIVFALGIWACTVATAAAHIQISPELAAPNDAVKFTVLVPGERAPHRTEEVVLKLPAGVLAYSFGSTPGWRRTTQDAGSGSVGTITWRGEAAPDGFVEFSFLAATPPKPGRIAWMALQVYDDGKVVRWIGGPDSESPAPLTDIRADAPLQNAGGEGAGDAASIPPVDEAIADSAAPVPAHSSDDGDDRLSLWLAICAFVLAGAALAVAARRRA